LHDKYEGLLKKHQKLQSDLFDARESEFMVDDICEDTKNSFHHFLDGTKSWSNPMGLSIAQIIKDLDAFTSVRPFLPLELIVTNLKHLYNEMVKLPRKGDLK
jgi:hypothetical protein